MVWNPTDALNLSIDVYQITISDRITLSSTLSTTPRPVHDYLAANGITNPTTAASPTSPTPVNTRTRRRRFGRQLPHRLRQRRHAADHAVGYNYNKNKVTEVKPEPGRARLAGR